MGIPTKVTQTVTISVEELEALKSAANGKTGRKVETPTSKTFGAILDQIVRLLSDWDKAAETARKAVETAKRTKTAKAKNAAIQAVTVFLAQTKTISQTYDQGYQIARNVYVPDNLGWIGAFRDLTGLTGQKVETNPQTGKPDRKVETRLNKVEAEIRAI